MGRSSATNFDTLRLVYSTCFKELYQYATTQLESKQVAHALVIDTLVAYEISKRTHKDLANTRKELEQRMVFACKFHTLVKRNAKQRITLELLINSSNSCEPVPTVPVRLSKVSKQVFRLLYVQGLQIEEAAKHLHLTVAETNSYYELEQKIMAGLLHGARI